MIDEAWYPCVFEITVPPGKMQMAGPLFNNVDGAPFQMMFRLPLPTRKGHMKLHVKGLNVGIIKADPANCISQISVNGMTFGAMNVLFESTEHVNMKQLKTYPFAPQDCSNFDTVAIRVWCSISAPGGLGITYVTLNCYYA